MSWRLKLGAAVVVCVAATALATSADAQLAKSLKDHLGGGTSPASNSLGSLGSLGSKFSMPSIGSSNAGSAAGVLQYCIENNELNADAASSVKDRLLQKAGVSADDSQYQKGSQGLLSGANGQSFDLGDLKGKAVKKACGYVLDKAKSFL